MTSHVDAESPAGFTGQQPRAVRKALGMLEAVAQLGPGTTAKEIARFAGVAPTTAYRMLNLLVAEGFLVRVPDLSGFALGRRTAELSRAAAATDTSASLHETVETLRSHTRFGLHVASFTGGRLRFVDQDPDHEIVGIALLAKNLHANALGKLMLAHHPALGAGLELRRLTDYTVCDPDALRAELTRSHRDGHTFENQECRLGRSALAVPVRNHAAEVVGGLCLQGSPLRVSGSDPELLGFLHDGSRQLTGLL
ncbi:IclR family transcriptional regulator [Rhodococcus sp. RD6.2]|jgi:DNA-binding IclR family transcriptional regulator|uniref:IclR family transcriptional regulator n=1 Tax=Rhodococcus sp. RD6.2 TaxID=260936 RepID=UPI00063BA369|nr:IclR family transcriptional regulator C-terminal domain-containing protein [Rhodococcus sp. RD6.2]CRK53781.1 IclR family transcriptional regulator [Rhodococcus sp. RD6.2]